MKIVHIAAFGLCFAIPTFTYSQEPAGHRALFSMTDKICPALHIREASPAALLDAQESFIQTLSAKEKQRLDLAEPKSSDGGYAECNGKNGASCDVEAGMRAFRETGLTHNFANFVCQKFGSEQK